jgi:hypothetical protein
MLWSDEPPLLVMRDVLWIGLPVAVALSIVVGAIVPAMFPFALGAFALALWAYVGNVIFGIFFGAPAIITASVAYAALLVLNIIAAAAPSWLGLPSADPWGMGLLTAMWSAFTIGYAQRDAEWSASKFFSFSPFGKCWQLTLAGVALGLIVALSLAGGSGQLAVGFVILVLILAFPFAIIGAWAGAAFKSEGETQQPFGDTGLLLPYQGARYCLQGPYGFWTHHDENEGCMDFSMPGGTTVVCAKEGHLLVYNDRKDYLPEQPPNRDAPSPLDTNFVRIRHREGAVACYANLDPGSVTGEIPSMEGAFGPLSVTNAMDVSAVEHENPLHVQAGHILGKSGFSRPPVPSTNPAWWVFAVGCVWAAITFGIVLLVPALDPDGEPPPTLEFPMGADHCYHYASYHDEKIREEEWAGMIKSEQRIHAAVSASAPQCSSFVPSEDNPPTAPEDPAQRAAWEECERLKDPLRKKVNLCYCESLSNGLIEEPANTWSDLGFIICGLAILFAFSKSGPNGLPYRNRMTTTTFYPLMFGLVLIFMGPGSMYFHAWQIVIGGSFDGVSMYALCSFMIAYNWVRIMEDDTWFHPWFWGCLLVASIINFAFMAAKFYNTDYIMFALMGGAIGLQIAAAAHSHIQTDHFGRVMFFLGGFLVVLAGVFQLTSNLDGPLCNVEWEVFSPSSAIQGHAIWHVLAAIGLSLVYLYFRHQMDRPPNQEFPRLHFAVREKPPAGNPIDEEPRVPAEGQQPADLKFKPVSFLDPGVAIHGQRPRSMRMHVSGNGPVSPPPVPPNFAGFRPEGGGSHPVEMN